MIKAPSQSIIRVLKLIPYLSFNPGNEIVETGTKSVLFVPCGKRFTKLHGYIHSL